VPSIRNAAPSIRPDGRLALDLADLELGYYSDAFEGFGYLGERGTAMRTAAGRERAALVDAAVLVRANELGWTTDQLFAWANSRDGRWFGDAVFGADVFGPVALERAIIELGPGGFGLGPARVR
jgi:hypothetical protein